MKIAIAEWAVGAGELILMLALPLYVVVAGGTLVSLFAWRSRRALAVVAAAGKWAASTGLCVFALGRCLLGFGWVTVLIVIGLPPALLPLALIDVVFDGAWRTAALLVLHLVAFFALRPIGLWLMLTDEERRWRELQPFLPGLEPPRTTWS